MAKITQTRIRNYVAYFIKRQGFTKTKAIKYVARDFGLSENLVKLALRGE